MPSPTASAPSRPRRADIQGLRALAVLLVIGDHVAHRPSGGFIGVDVFFVVSGFLITGVLLREHERTGRISVRAFIGARLRRIAPPALTVLAATVGLSWLLLSQGRATGVTLDAGWAALGGANLHQILLGADYFAQSATVSPLLHFWSLSVEEQFYLVWPWLLIGLATLAARRGGGRPRRARSVVQGGIAAVVAASLTWALIDSTAHPVPAYYSPFSRAWELAVGGLLAVAAPAFANLGRRSRAVLLAGGLVGILGSAVLITSDVLWPAPWALIPVVATAAVLASGIGGTAPGAVLLANRASVFVGDISYSLYLWHLPALVFALSLFPQSAVLAASVAVLSAFALATAQYVAVERPVWHSPLFVRGASSDDWRAWRGRHARTARRGVLGALVTVACVACTAAVVPLPTPVVVDGDAPFTSLVADRPVGPEAASVQRSVRDALSATRWPGHLDPSIDDLGVDQAAPEWTRSGCLSYAAGETGESPEQLGARCVFGEPGASRRAVLVGDSVAISWAPAIRAALGPAWSVTILTMGQCPFAFAAVTRMDGSDFAECDRFHVYAAQTVSSTTPDLVFLSQSDSSAGRTTTGSAGAAMDEGLDRALGRYAAAAGAVVVLPAPPERPNLWTCYSVVSSPASCISSVGDAHVQADAALTASAGRSGALFVDTDPLFCAESVCPAFVGGSVVTVDKIHLTARYSRELGSALREALEPLLGAPDPLPGAPG